MAVWVGMLGVTGCAGHLPWMQVPRTDPTRVPITVPAHFSLGDATGPVAEQWWRDFGDEALSAWIERSLSGNLGIRQAWARLAQANAVLTQTAAGRLPEISGEAQASRNRSVFFAGEELGERQFVSEQLLGAFAASWEVDLWRRIGSLQDAARLDREAARDDLEGVAITLAAEIADTWFSLVQQKAQLRLLARQESVSNRFRELIELRFGSGLASAPDVFRQRQQVASVREQMPLVRAQIAVLEHRLQVLSGRAPERGWHDGAMSLPELPPLPATGLPGALLRRRPDVRAAEGRVVAADHRVASAIADRFPAIRLTGRTGYQGFEASTLPDNWIWTIASNLVTPIFDAGRRRAEVDRSRAALEERLAAYGESVLRAFEEVENALVQETEQRERIGHLEQQVDFARRTLREIRGRYANGLTDYLNVLTALQSLQQLERAELAARRDLISARIRLCRALGGTWTKGLEPRTRMVNVNGS